MRLIDADKMKLEVNSANPLIKEYAKEIENWRDTQPTVKAIPIEWIRKYINSIGGSNKVTWLHKEHLKTMLKDWEKENDR